MNDYVFKRAEEVAQKRGHARIAKVLQRRRLKQAELDKTKRFEASLLEQEQEYLRSMSAPASPAPRQGRELLANMQESARTLMALGGQAPYVDTPVIVGNGEEVPEEETVADDVPVDVPEGAFVINAAAKEKYEQENGEGSLEQLIISAMQELPDQGVDNSPSEDTISNEEKVKLLVSKEEVIIPPDIAQIIGYSTLEQINEAGIPETEKRMAVASGGFISRSK